MTSDNHKGFMRGSAKAVPKDLLHAEKHTFRLAQFASMLIVIRRAESYGRASARIRAT
jgi:hypothetical protein